jgi:hypothetical protein
MRIEDYHPSVETNGTPIYEGDFQIGNIGRIMVILRNSMYSNPIKAIAREISCNARDAHREIGTPDRPIEIHIPNVFDEHYSIKDYGPGISPQRMDGVFIRYGTSTKNTDDVQTGGFGLGAKTPFAYSDQFSITTTTVNDDGSHTRRVYIAYIDSSSAGKMRLISEETTDEETGTEISLKVAEDDWKSFANATVEVCQYWNVLPILKGNGIPNWPEKEEFVFETKEYRLCKKISYYESKSLAIIDGISYPMNSDNILLSGEDISTKREILRTATFIVNNGEMTLSANREELQYDVKTQKLINGKLDLILSEIKTLALDKISEATSYTDAVKNYLSIRKGYSFSLPNDFVPEWNGNKVQHKFDIENPPVSDVDEIRYSITDYCFKNNRRYQLQFSSREAYSIETTIPIIVNDLSDSSVAKNRVESFLDKQGAAQNNGLFTQVITFSKLDVEKGLESFKKYNEFDLNLLDIVYLSSIEPIKKDRQKREKKTAGRSLAKAFIFSQTYQGNRKCDNYWKPEEVDVADGEGVYVITSGQNNIIKSDDNILSPEDIEIITTYFGDIKIYAIRERDKGNIGPNWVSLKDYVEEEINSKLEENNITLEQLLEIPAQANKGYHDGYKTYYYSSNACKILDKVYNIHKTGVLAEYIEASKVIYKNNEKYSRLIRLIKAIKTNKFPDTNGLPLALLLEKVKTTYPLLDFVNWNMFERSADPIYQYVCLVDASLDKGPGSGYIATTVQDNDGEDNEY